MFPCSLTLRWVLWTIYIFVVIAFCSIVSSVFQPISGLCLVRYSACALHLPVCSLYHICTVVHGVRWACAQRSVCAERATRAQLRPSSWKRCIALPNHVFHSASRGSSAHARLRLPGWRERWGVASQNTVFKWQVSLVSLLFRTSLLLCLNFFVFTWIWAVTFLLMLMGVTFLVFAFLLVGFAITLRCNTTLCINNITCPVLTLGEVKLFFYPIKFASVFLTVLVSLSAFPPPSYIALLLHHRSVVTLLWCPAYIRSIYPWKR